MNASKLFPIVALLVGLTGCTLVVDNKLEAKPAPDGGGSSQDEFCRGEADGFNCSTAEAPGRICVSFRCVPQRCGDGYTDATRGEQCDDANTTPNDGCEADCTLTCASDEDCDDHNLCTGAEICTLTHADLPTCSSDPAVLIPPVGAECTFPLDGGVGEGLCDDQTRCQP